MTQNRDNCKRWRYPKARGCCFLALCLWSSLQIFAGESYSIILDQLRQKSENEIQFDVLLKNEGADFYLNDLQVEITFNEEIITEGAYFSNSGLNILPGSSDLLNPPCSNNFTLAEDNQRLIIVSEKPETGNILQKVETGELLRIATLQMIVFYENKRGVYVNKEPTLQLDQYATMIQRAQVDSDNQKVNIGYLLKNRQLVNSVSSHKLCNYVFTGNGFWHEKQGAKYLNWNNHPETHENYANQLPIAGADVLIGGEANIGHGEMVMLTSILDPSGSVRISNTRIESVDQKYMLLLNSNCADTDLLLLNSDFEILENPSYLHPDTEVFFGAYNDHCGNFVAWTDQDGNLIGQDNQHGPYSMPARDIILTANWEHGELNKSGENINKMHVNLKTGPGAPSLSIAPNASLSVSELQQGQAGSLVLQGGGPDDVPGSLILDNGGVEATVEMFIGRHGGEGPQSRWHMIASPVQDMPIRPEFVPDGIIPQWIDFYKWDESHTATADGEEVSGWWINSKTPGGTWNDSFENDFQAGTGYLLAYGQPDKSYGDRIHSFSGHLNTESLPVNNLSHTPGGQYAGWHLLGNPFPSAIDWTKGDWQRQNILGGPKIWDSQWSSYSPIVDIIPAMSGFMVHTSGNGSLVIPAEARVHHSDTEPIADSHNPHPSYKETPRGPNYAPDSHYPANPMVCLLAQDPGGHTAQKTIILFRDEATLSHDPLYDTPFKAGHAPHFWSLPPNADNPKPDNPSPRLALNNLPSPEEPLAIPLGFRKNESNSFHIESLQNTTPYALFLEDTRKALVRPLKPDEPYLFSATENDPERRFVLHLTDGQPPVPIGEQEHPATITASRNHLLVHTRCDHCTLDILNIRGMLMMHTTLNHQGEHHLAHNLNPGVYIARFRCQSHANAMKFFVP